MSIVKPAAEEAKKTPEARHSKSEPVKSKCQTLQLLYTFTRDLFNPPERIVAPGNCQQASYLFAEYIFHRFPYFYTQDFNEVHDC